jgi:hypothetical protein
MTDTKKTVQRSKTDDMRRVETHVEEAVQGAATERVTTVKEEVIPMAVKKVVRETIVPVVTSRKIESYEDGKVVRTEHEVVPDEALRLGEYEAKVTHEDIARIVDETFRRNISALKQAPVPAPVASDEEEVAPKSVPKKAREVIQERNETGKFFGFEFDPTLLLYSALALEAAAIVYLTVLKGWLLN